MVKLSEYLINTLVNLPETGMPDNGPIYYEMRGENEYVVWFGKRLGESEMYNSKEKEWALRD